MCYSKEFRQIYFLFILILASLIKEAITITFLLLSIVIREIFISLKRTISVSDQFVFMKTIFNAAMHPYRKSGFGIALFFPSLALPFSFWSLADRALMRGAEPYLQWTSVLKGCCPSPLHCSTGRLIFLRIYGAPSTNSDIRSKSL